MAQNWSLEQLLGECSDTMDRLSALAGQAASFQFPEGRKSVEAFNWAELLEKMEGGDGAAEQRAGEIHAMLSEHAAEQVDFDPQVPRWVPFAVVPGAGMLFFDLLAVHQGQPTVLWEQPDGKRTELGLSEAFFSTLQS
jgi:hypothetical protein